MKYVIAALFTKGCRFGPYASIAPSISFFAFRRLRQIGLDEPSLHRRPSSAAATVSASVPGSLLSPSAALRADATTFAPSMANRAQIASPMPRLAPSDNSDFALHFCRSD